MTPFSFLTCSASRAFDEIPLRLGEHDSHVRHGLAHRCAGVDPHRGDGNHWDATPQRRELLNFEVPYLASNQVTVDFETGRGFTASGGECGEARDQTVPLPLRHVVYDPGDFLAAARGDRVHDPCPRGLNSTTTSRREAGCGRRSIKPALTSRSTMRPVVERCT